MRVVGDWGRCDVNRRMSSSDLWMLLMGWVSYEPNNPNRCTNLGAYPTAQKSIAIKKKQVYTSKSEL